MNKEELRQFIDFKTCGKQVDIDDLEIWIEDAHNWEVELGCINYLLGQILEKKRGNTKACLSIIDLIYKLDEQLSLRIHECDYDFVIYMVRNIRRSDSTLEDELVLLHNRICEHIYERNLCR
jgi:hypothetical protein